MLALKLLLNRLNPRSVEEVMAILPGPVQGGQNGCFSVKT